MISLEKSKVGVYTLKYNNKYIHSKYDPINEAKKFIENNKGLVTKDNVVIYGLGLGYHIEELLKVNKNSNVYVFEWNKALIKYCKEVNESLFNIKNVNIITDNNNFFEFLGEKLNEVEDILIHTPSLETIKENNVKLYNLIKNYKIAKHSIEVNSELLMENYKNNLNTDYKEIKELINSFSKINKPYIVTAAGPSLDRELEFLKRNREDFVVVAVGSSLRALMNNNIKPDIISIIDGKEDVAKQLKDYEESGIPLCFLSTASRWAVNNYKGPKYMFFNRVGENEIVIDTGKTVAVSCISIALKCGAKEIILLGQDLAYLNGKSHTSTYEKTYGQEDSPIINNNCKLVKGIDGTMLKTTEGYLYFKEQIEKIISRNKQVKFINCSKGAFIEGAEHIEFSNYLGRKS